jgi:hypothetical protein
MIADGVNSFSKDVWKTIGIGFQIIGILYSVTTLAKWYYIVTQGKLYDPMQKIEKDALKYFNIQRVERNVHRR